jgi:hypothetical protein
MTAIYFDSAMNDADRRERLYAGDIFVFSPAPAVLALADFAREFLEEAFHPWHPTEAQYHMPVERFVEIFAPLKPRFIHHPRTKELIKAVLIEHGCSLEDTYLDVPRLRGVTSDGYLTSGVGYAHHPHRDTWFSAPMCQLNWWFPLYPYDKESAMNFIPRYWSEVVPNDSEEFNYFEWNAIGRAQAAKSIKSDTRKQPKSKVPLSLEPDIRIVCNVGGVILFSPAHLHAAVPNTTGKTRFSIDFRSVNFGDVLAHRGAPNIDSHSPTSALRDFMRPSDLSRVPEEVVRTYETVAPPDDSSVVYQPRAGVGA